MLDGPLRYLWAIAIIVRGCAVLFCWRKSPRWWMVWVGFSECSAILMRFCDAHRWSWYGPAWVCEQVANVVILACVIREAVMPTEIGVFAAIIFSALAVVSVHAIEHLAFKLLDPTMEICGALMVAFGILATLGGIARGGVYRLILAGYLILNAVLLLAAPEYLDNPGLGRAWNLLEIGAFAAWMAVFSRPKKAYTDLYGWKRL